MIIQLWCFDYVTSRVSNRAWLILDFWVIKKHKIKLLKWNASMIYNNIKTQGGSRHLMREADIYTLCRSSLEVGSNQLVILLFAQHFLLLQTLAGRVCVCVCTFFISFSTANKPAFPIGYISSASNLNLSLLGRLFCLFGGKKSSERRLKESKTQRRRRRKNTQTWRRKRAFILRSNHGSSWYAGKWKGGRGVTFEGVFNRRYQQTKPVYQQWRGHCATTGHFLYVWKWLPGVYNLQDSSVKSTLFSLRTLREEKSL